MFVGRKTERADLIDAILGTDARPIAILGPPGIGKSALTRRALHDAKVAERFGARRWFVRLDAASDERALWTTILAELGIDSPGADPAVQVLARLGDGDGLLVLDNLETPWNADEEAVEEALARLADAPGIRVVASIRGMAWPGRVDWLLLPTVEALTHEWARKLFLAVAGEGYAEDPDLEAIVAALDGLPLAIDLIARQAQGSQTLKGLRADFEERKGKLFELGDTKERSLKASLQLSLDSPKMTAAGKRLFTALGRLPTGAALQDLNKLITGGGSAAGRVLCQLGLAFEEGDRLRMLAPIREHAALRQMRDVTAILKLYLDLAKTEGGKIGEMAGAEATARLTPEIANLEATIDLAIKDRKAKRAVAAFDGFARFLMLTGVGSARPLERLLASVQQTLDHQANAHCQFRLGDIALHRSDHDAARDHYQRAMPLFQKADHVQGEASCIFSLGEIALYRSDYDAARDLCQRAMPLFQKVGDVQGEASCIFSLGQIAVRRSDHDAARDHYQRAMLLFLKAGHIQGEANCIFSLGEIALHRSDYDAARDLFQRAMSLYQEAGHVQAEANCIRGLGDIALRRSDHDEARDHFQRAMLLFHEAGHVSGQAFCEWAFGEIARERGEHELAAEHYAPALALFRQVHDQAGEARCLLGMGQIERALNRAGAEAQLRQAFSVFDAIHELEGRGKALLELAALAEDAEAKQGMLLDALDSHSRFGNPYWIGESHRRLARISVAEERQRHVTLARDAWTSIDRPDRVAELDAEFDGR